MKITLEIPNPPIQDRDFDEDDIRGMSLRRFRLADGWQVPHPPSESGKDWTLIFPFPNTYQNAFVCMCDAFVYPHQSPTGRLCLFVKGLPPGEALPGEIGKWIKCVGRYVAMKDFLALSFALDYDRHGGNPNKPQTDIGSLRARAKPYGSEHPSRQTKEAAGRLVEHCMSFLEEMTCYRSADCVVAIPPSNPDNAYNLPRYLAKKIASKLGYDDLTANVRTKKPRKSLKDAVHADKLATLMGTIEVDPHAFHRKNVLLVDDLYQSGITMNYCALMLLRAGATRVFGLACEKACRNDDNVGGR